MTKSLTEKTSLLNGSKDFLSLYLSTDSSHTLSSYSHLYTAESREKLCPHALGKVNKSIPQECKTCQLWQLTIDISLMSFLLSIALCIAGIVCASLRSSASTAAFAADCLLDALASLIVFWRYWRASKGYHVEEHFACLWLGGLIIISSLGVIAKAIADLITPTEVGNAEWLFWLSIAGSVTFIFTSVAKYWLYRLLKNQSILLDSVNTFLSGLFCVAIAITVKIMEMYPHLWYLDPLEGGFFGLLMAIYGFKCFIDNCFIARQSHKKILAKCEFQRIASLHLHSSSYTQLL